MSIQEGEVFETQDLDTVVVVNNDNGRLTVAFCRESVEEFSFFTTTQEILSKKLQNEVIRPAKYPKIHRESNFRAAKEAYGALAREKGVKYGKK